MKLKTAVNPSKVVVHVVACGTDMHDAEDIAKQANDALENCLFNTRRQVVPWVLPLDSGFRAQLSGTCVCVCVCGVSSPIRAAPLSASTNRTRSSRPLAHVHTRLQQ